MNARSIAALGIGFGALAISTIGIQSDFVEMPITQPGYHSPATPRKNGKTRRIMPDLAEQSRQREEDSLFLLIM